MMKERPEIVLNLDAHFILKRDGTYKILYDAGIAGRAVQRGKADSFDAAKIQAYQMECF